MGRGRLPARTWRSPGGLEQPWVTGDNRGGLCHLPVLAVPLMVT